jgi:hypothetical protein
MSSPSRFAGSITASFIGRVMRLLGGRSSTSIHFQSHSGSGRIVRPIASTPGRNCKADQRRCRRGRDREAGLLLSVYAQAFQAYLVVSVVPVVAVTAQSRCQPQKVGCQVQHEPHRGQPRPRMAPPRRRSGDDRIGAGPDEPTTYIRGTPLPPSRYGSLHPLYRREGRRPSSQHETLRPGAGKLSSMTWTTVSMLVSDSEVRTRAYCKGLRTSGSGHWRPGPYRCSRN